MTRRFTTLCPACSRFRSGDACLAFPDGIPEGIQRFGESHLEPVEGDGGITFNLKAGDEAAESFASWKRSNPMDA